MKKTVQIAFCGVLSALSFVLLLVGTLIDIFVYIAPLICGLIMIILTESFGKKAALTAYASTSILCLFLLTGKEAGLLYIAFFGYYPIIKDKLDALRPRLFSLFLKFLLFNAQKVQKTARQIF